MKNTFFLLRFVSTRLFILSGRAEDPTGVLTLPKAVFNVQAGFRYRFRIVSAGFLFCPLRISVDDHTLLLIATDGKPFVPFEVNEGIILIRPLLVILNHELKESKVGRKNEMNNEKEQRKLFLW